MQDLPEFGCQIPKFSLDQVSKDIQTALEERSGYAHVMVKQLIKEMQEFQITLQPDEEIAAYLASSLGGHYFFIQSIKERDPYYIVFSGTTENGQKVRLVQHVTQTNVFLVSVKVELEDGRKARRFGFDTSS